MGWVGWISLNEHTSAKTLSDKISAKLDQKCSCPYIVPAETWPMLHVTMLHVTMLHVTWVDVSAGKQKPGRTSSSRI